LSVLLLGVIRPAETEAGIGKKLMIERPALLAQNHLLYAAFVV
jgi:hypothetical protein